MDRAYYELALEDYYDQRVQQAAAAAEAAVQEPGLEPEAEPEPDRIVFGPCDRQVPYTLTPEAETELDAAEAEAEYEAEWADEWDSADSDAYQARVEAGLEPEADL